jgi:hypothetical protein
MKSLRSCFVLAFCLLLSTTPNLKSQSGDRNLLLPGATPAQAEQELGKILQNLALASQVDLILKAKQPDQQVSQNLTKVAIRLESNCGFEQLVMFLDAIKSYETFLRVEELTVNSFPMKGRTEIRPSLTVSGFIEIAPDHSRAQAWSLDKGVDSTGALLFRHDQNLEIMKELTSLLPPDAVLATYRNRDCAIQLIGLFPPSSSYDLMEKLEKSPLLKDVTSVGTIYVDPSTGKERAMFAAKCEK